MIATDCNRLQPIATDLRDMHNHVIPAIERKPNFIELQIDTNDLPSMRGEEEQSEGQSAEEIICH